MMGSLQQLLEGYPSRNPNLQPNPRQSYAADVAAAAKFMLTCSSHHHSWMISRVLPEAYLRRQEMIAAGAALGADTVWRCGYNDGMLISIHESDVRSRIAAVSACGDQVCLRLIKMIGPDT